MILIRLVRFIYLVMLVLGSNYSLRILAIHKLSTRYASFHACP